MALAAVAATGCEAVAPAALEALTPVAVTAVNRYFDSFEDPPDDAPAPETDSGGAPPVDYEPGGPSTPPDPSPGPTPRPGGGTATACQKAIGAIGPLLENARSKETSGTLASQRRQTIARERVPTFENTREGARERAKWEARQKARSAAAERAAVSALVAAAEVRYKAWEVQRECESTITAQSSTCRRKYLDSTREVPAARDALRSSRTAISLATAQKVSGVLRDYNEALTRCMVPGRLTRVPTDRISRTFAVRTRSADTRLFDCREVEDEFERLVFGAVIENPGAFVPTIGGRISRPQLEEILEQQPFTLGAERSAMGIGLVRTSAGQSARFLFTWVDQDGGPPALLIEDPTLVDDQVALRRPSVLLRPSEALDLDAGPIVTPRGANDLDIGYRIEEGTPIIESLGDAAVEFPARSLCAPPYPGNGSAEDDVAR